MRIIEGIRPSPTRRNPKVGADLRGQDLTLAQGISRGERMDYTLQKAVELGVSRIVPIASQRSVVRLSAGALALWMFMAKPVSCSGRRLGASGRGATTEVRETYEEAASGSGECDPTSPLKTRTV